MTNDEAPMSKQPPRDRKYDLEERCALFGEAIVKFAKRVPVTAVTIPLIDQLVRAGTSVGSNYDEADDAESRRDFRHKIGICRKESKESKHWLRMIAAAIPAGLGCAAALAGSKGVEPHLRRNLPEL